MNQVWLMLLAWRWAVAASESQGACGALLHTGWVACVDLQIKGCSRCIQICHALWSGDPRHVRSHGCRHSMNV